jgi:hypothetical protein
VIHQPPPACVCCGGKVLRKIADDLTEVLEYVPSSFKVMQHVRPKLSCRDCETIVQAALPSFPIERGRPGPGLLAHVAVSKYADGLPLHRQSVIYARQGVDLDRSTMAIEVDEYGNILDGYNRTKVCSTPIASRTPCSLTLMKPVSVATSMNSWERSAMTLFGEPRGRPGPLAQGAWRGHIGIKPGRIYPRSPPDHSSDLPTTKDDIPNLLYHGSRGFYIGPVSSLGCGAAPGGLPLLAPAGRVSLVQLPGVAAFGATTGRGTTTSPGLASGANLGSLSLVVPKLCQDVAQPRVSRSSPILRASCLGVLQSPHSPARTL